MKSVGEEERVSLLVAVSEGDWLLLLDFDAVREGLTDGDGVNVIVGLLV